MARHSQTEVAVLGALSTGPMSGYELRAAITEVLGHFWHESYGQIYPCLPALEEAGSVRRTGPGRTSGTVLEITPSARTGCASCSPSRTPPPPPATVCSCGCSSAPPAEGEAETLLQEARRGPAQRSSTTRDARRHRRRRQAREQALRTITLSFGEHVARAQLDLGAGVARDTRGPIPDREGTRRARG